MDESTDVNRSEPGTTDASKQVKINKPVLKNPKFIIAFALVFGIVGVTLLAFSRAAPPDEFRGMRGEVAVEHLDKRMNSVAKRNGMNSDKLKEILLADPTLEVSANDMLNYVEPAFQTEEQAETSVAEAAGVTTAPFPLDQTFKLHSDPSSTKKLYLDFDGHTTSGTSWNSSYTNGQPIVSAPMDNDSDPTSFSAAEREKIQYVWARVTEDFAPYNIDVTTEDPGAEGIKRTNSTDGAYGIRVIISPTNFYGSAGGVCYYNSFGSGLDFPCFVFITSAHKGIAEASSHEAGHSLGVHHDGYLTDTYYAGQGNWVPIMGVSYYKPISQWSNGEYTNSTTKEDDLAIILNRGVQLYGDDAGDTIQSAKAMTGNSTSATANGKLATRADKDVFSFTTTGGISVQVTPAALIEPNLDVKIRILRADGTVVAEADPVGTVAPLISTAAAAGTYYVEIDGVGYLDPASTGYSDYDSLGDYRVAFSASGFAPIAKVSSSSGCVSLSPSCTINFSSTGSSDPDGDPITYLWNFGDGTASSTLASPSHTFSSYGSFTVTLTVTDSRGLTGSATKVVTVTQASTIPPIAVASANPSSGTAPLGVQFSPSGSRDPGGGTISYLWDFGDGTASSTVQNAYHTYTTPGVFNAKLTITTTSGASSGLKSSTTVVITVGTGTSTNNPPTAAATATPQSGNAPLTVVLSGAGSSDPEGSTLTYSWDFGDGTAQATTQSATHTYTTAGTYTAKLTVADSQGATASKSIVITVATPPPPPANKKFSIQSLTLTTGTSGRNKYALANIVLIDQDGKPLPGATVTGAWSGLVTGTGSVITGTNGSGSIRSKSIKKTGAITFTITSINGPQGGTTTYTWDGVVKNASVSL